MAAAQVAGVPTASTATWLPPPVRSCTWAATSAPDLPVALTREQRVLGTQAARQGERCLSAVDGDHPGSGRHGDLYRAETHAADPDDRHPLAAPDPGPGIQRAVGGGEPAAQAGRRSIADDVGDRDQVGVGGV